MGLCGSKPNKPSQVHTEQTNNQMTRTATVRARTSTTRTEQGTTSLAAGRTSNKTIANNNGGRRLLESSTQTKLSPREAARLAAERRLKEQNGKLTKGELGKRLARERAKTYRK